MAKLTNEHDVTATEAPDEHAPSMSDEDRAAWLEEVKKEYQATKERYQEHRNTRYHARIYQEKMIWLEKAWRGIENRYAVRGICAKCGHQIPVQRIEAMPFSIWCKNCIDIRGTKPDRISTATTPSRREPDSKRPLVVYTFKSRKK